MLKDTDKLKSHADVMGKIAASIQDQAKDVLFQLKAFQDWGKKATAELGDRHTALKAAMDDSHAGVLAELAAMDEQLASIIKKLEGENPNG